MTQSMFKPFPKIDFWLVKGQISRFEDSNESSVIEIDLLTKEMEDYDRIFNQEESTKDLKVFHYSFSVENITKENEIIFRNIYENQNKWYYYILSRKLENYEETIKGRLFYIGSPIKSEFLQLIPTSIHTSVDDIQIPTSAYLTEDEFREKATQLLKTFKRKNLL